MKTFEVDSLKTICSKFRKHRWVEETGSWSGMRLLRCLCGAVHYPKGKKPN